MTTWQCREGPAAGCETRWQTDGTGRNVLCCVVLCCTKLDHFQTTSSAMCNSYKMRATANTTRWSAVITDSHCLSALPVLSLLTVTVCQHYLCCHYWQSLSVNITCVVITDSHCLSALPVLSLLTVTVCKHYLCCHYWQSLSVNITCAVITDSHCLSALPVLSLLTVTVCQHYLCCHYWQSLSVSITCAVITDSYCLSALPVLSLLTVTVCQHYLCCHYWQSLSVSITCAVITDSHCLSALPVYCTNSSTPKCTGWYFWQKLAHCLWLQLIWTERSQVSACCNIHTTAMVYIFWYVDNSAAVASNPCTALDRPWEFQQLGFAYFKTVGTWRC